MIKRATMAIFQLASLKNFNLLVSGSFFLQIPKDLGSHPESPNLSRLVASSLPRQEYSKLLKDKDREFSLMKENHHHKIMSRVFVFSFRLVGRDIGITDKAILDLHRWANPIQNGENTISIQTEIKGFAWLFTADINELNHKRNRSTAGKKRS